MVLSVSGVLGKVAVRLSSLRHGGFWRCWMENSISTMNLTVSPVLSDLPDGWILVGILSLDVTSNDLWQRGKNSVQRQYEVVCHPQPKSAAADDRRPEGCDPFVLRASVSFELVEGRFPSVDIVLKPRTTLQNMLPLPLVVESPMPHILSSKSLTQENTNTFMIGNGCSIEIFTPGPSVAVRMKCEMPL